MLNNMKLMKKSKTNTAVINFGIKSKMIRLATLLDKLSNK